MTDFDSIPDIVGAKVFPSYVRIITNVMETIFYSSKKGKDTSQCILGYFAKYLRILGQVS